jgi:myo-inositol 2-dehydrogenase/D-chiro-inositol 1-dehydrogenase
LGVINHHSNYVTSQFFYWALLKDFLWWLSLLVLFLVFNQMAEVVNFVLFGLGRAGSIHANNMLNHPLVRILYIVEADTVKAQQFVQSQDKLRGTCLVLHADEKDKALSDSNVHAAMCASTTSTHEAIIRACYQFKKPVFTEKPVAETVERTLEVCKLSTELNVPLFCGFHRRLDSQFMDLKKKVDSGVIGRPMIIKSTSRDYPTNCSVEYIKISGGQFVDQTVHDIDMCMWIIGERPHTVMAMGHAFYPDIAAVPDTDTVTLMLQFPSGVMATIDNSRRATFGYDTRFEVYGDVAMVTLENLRPSAVVVHSESGEVRGSIYNHFATRYHDAYYSELDHFIGFLQGREKKLRITADEAFAAVKVSQAAAESFKRKEQVKLNW